MPGQRPQEIGAEVRAWFAAAPGASSTPPLGWIRTIRAASGMTQQDLARRLGITAQSAFRLEANERNGTIRVDSLRRVAEALDCEMIYALVPRGGPAGSTQSEAIDARPRPRPERGPGEHPGVSAADRHSSHRPRPAPRPT